MTFHPEQCQAWSVPHGYFPGTFEQQKLNVQYDPEGRYLKHRAEIVTSLGLDSHRLVFANQIHSNAVCVIDNALPIVAPTCDGLVTNVPGVTLGVYTADCAPILFWDTQGAIGVCHAGWKGALYGVLEHTVDKMRSISTVPHFIQACIGPTIRFKDYEVSSDFQTVFMTEDPKSAAFFHEKPKLCFDLPGYIAQRLHRAQCHTVFDSGQNTFSSRFFSRRFQTQENISSLMCFGSVIGTFSASG